MFNNIIQIDAIIAKDDLFSIIVTVYLHYNVLLIIKQVMRPGHTVY